MRQIFTFLLLVCSMPIFSQNAQTCYEDNDMDGYGDPNKPVQSLPGSCPLFSVSNSDDCDDNDASVYPKEYYRDADGDGYPDRSIPVSTHCGFVQGYRSVSEADGEHLPDDCNDQDALVHPKQLWYVDKDKDHFPSSAPIIIQCARPSLDYAARDELDAITPDCDDNDPIQRPNQLWYEDQDHDGYPSSAPFLVQCTRPQGYRAIKELTATTIDCDDNDASTKPNTDWYKDEDDDGYSDLTHVTQCFRPVG